MSRRLAKGAEVNPAHVKAFTPVELTAEGAFARQVFEEIQRGSPDAGWSLVTVTWSEMHAWQKVTDTKLTPWMRRLVFTLNSIYRVKWIEKQKKDAKPK